MYCYSLHKYTIFILRYIFVRETCSVTLTCRILFVLYADSTESLKTLYNYACLFEATDRYKCKVCLQFYFSDSWTVLTLRLTQKLKRICI